MDVRLGKTRLPGRPPLGKLTAADSLPQHRYQTRFELTETRPRMEHVAGPISPEIDQY